MAPTPKTIDHLGKRLALLCLGLAVMAFGIAFSIKAGLGITAVSSLPYVAAEILGLTVGLTTVAANGIFVVLQMVMLGRNYQWFQVLQLPAGALFGLIIDLALVVLRPLGYSNALQQWALCGIGIFLLALGISVQIAAKLVPTAGEGLVLAICQVRPMKFGNAKMALDLVLVALSVVLSLACLGRISGVGLGTLAAALLVGQITKVTSRAVAKVEAALF